MAPTLLFLPFALLTLAFSHAFASPLPQNGDGGGSGALPDGGLGYDPSTAGDASPGSAGTDTGGVRLSKGAIIAIAVIAGLIIIAGITTAILFWGAKKRQWAVAETMRRSVRRVTTGLKAMTPRTPHKMTFSPIEKRRAGSFGDGLLGSKNKNSNAGFGGARGGGKDLEKVPTTSMSTRDASRGASADAGLPTGQPLRGGEQQQQQGRKQKRPTAPTVQVPSSKFEMDSPKTPMWNKVFGR